MNYRKNQAGFSIIEITIVLVVVSALAFVGYTVFKRQQTTKTATTESSQAAPASNSTSAPEVTTASDLDKASSTLDDASLNDSNDESQFDAQLANF